MNLIIIKLGKYVPISTKYLATYEAQPTKPRMSRCSPSIDTIIDLVIAL